MIAVSGGDSDSTPQPLVEVFANEVVVVQMRIGAIDAVDLFRLARAERFVGIEAPDAFEESLAAENFVEAGDAARKMIGGVEKGGVGVGDFDALAEKGRRNSGAGFC